jgi:prolipoprotein diacylglyceryl transferase
MELASIPSPSVGVVHLGPIPLRGYALCIIIGVFVAVWYGNKRWVARGGRSGTVADIAVWAVPFGLVGGRLYHVVSQPNLYFEKGEDWVNAFRVWDGGLGIWGAVALGALGAWIGCRRRGIPMPAWIDALAPAVAIAQAIGRWGNWFNQELYGRPTHLPWALHITHPAGDGVPGYYHPTFLYESIWCLIVAALVVWADRRFTLGHGRVFALYVALYCVGRGGTEYLRIDDANHILGLRLNLWTVMVVFVLAVIYFVLSARRHPGRETVVEPGGDDSGGAGAADAVGSSGTGGAASGTAVSGEDSAGKDGEDPAQDSDGAMARSDGDASVASAEDADAAAADEAPAEDAGTGAGQEAAAKKS